MHKAQRALDLRESSAVNISCHFRVFGPLDPGQHMDVAAAKISLEISMTRMRSL
jgi:hypothetical protein